MEADSVTSGTKGPDGKKGSATSTPSNPPSGGSGSQPPPSSKPLWQQKWTYECVVRPGASGPERWRKTPHGNGHRDGCYRTAECGCSKRYYSTFYTKPSEAGWRTEYRCEAHQR